MLLIYRFLAVLISFAGMVVDSVAWAAVENVAACVNANMVGFGEINNDTMLSAALCQQYSSRTIMTSSGYANVPYECGCVSKYNLGTFPVDALDCAFKEFDFFCEQALEDDPTLQTCVLNYPEISEYYGQNSTGYEASAKFCSLKNNISSGVINGCSCGK